MARFIPIACAAALFLCANTGIAEELVCTPESPHAGAKKSEDNVKEMLAALLGSPDTVFPKLKDAIAAKAAVKAPVKMIETGDKAIPQFPSYSACDRSFFRVATIPRNVDQTIADEGWKSGWVRREDDLKKQGQPISDAEFDALPPTASFEDRIIEYVRVKDVPSTFPKHSSVVGVLASPIRALSVAYHTGYNEGRRGNHMRMDEIEVGECASHPACKSITPADSTAVFAKRGLTPRYSTESEWAIDKHVPKECIVATYRIKFQKVDDKCYSDTHGNCKF